MTQDEYDQYRLPNPAKPTKKHTQDPPARILTKLTDCGTRLKLQQVLIAGDELLQIFPDAYFAKPLGPTECSSCAERVDATDEF